MPILEVRGTLSVSQFWPDGTSDADTVKVRVARVTYAGRPTRVLERAVIMPLAKPAINKHGVLTIRLQGIDAPELHYRPQVRAAKGNGQFRQHVAEAATLALGEFLGDGVVACRVRTLVERPTEVFDCYGRFVGDVQVRRQGRWVSLNEWLVAHGWAFPALYESMTIPEIKRMRSLAASARGRRSGVWAHYTTDADRFDRNLIFRGHGAAPRADRGCVSLPKMFRRASTWSVLESAENFAEYLHARPDGCYLTPEFLRGCGPRLRLESFLSDHGRLRVAPADLVFCERESALVDGRGAEIREW